MENQSKHIYLKPEESKEEKFKVYELDFGDTNLLSEKISDITDWIKADMEGMANKEKLDYRN